MRIHLLAATLGIAALGLGAGSVQAQTSTPTLKEQVQQKTDQAADKIKSTAEDMKTGITDSWITSKTKIALFGDERVKGRQVNVTTVDGVVMLRGKVDTMEAKAAAAEVAGRVEHVKDVKDELQVVAPTERSKVAWNDKIIAKNVQTMLNRDPDLRHAKVDVNDGVVSLTGEVKSIDASARASEMARGVGGVRYVKNDLTYAARTSSK